MLGTPVIVTPNEAFIEIGVKDGENGFIVDYDMKNIDIDKIYNSRLNFKYEPPRDTWNDILVDGKSTYFEDMKTMCNVRCIKNFIDAYTGKRIVKGTVFTVNEVRAEELIGKKKVEYDS